MSPETTEQNEVTVNESDLGVVANDVAEIVFKVTSTNEEVCVDYSVKPKSADAFVKHVGVSLVKLKNGLKMWWKSW